MDDPEVERVLERVPEFAVRYQALVEAYDGEPGAAVAYEELAVYAAELGVELDRSLPVLRRIFAVVEELVAVQEEGGDGEEDPGDDALVTWSFLDSLCPDDVRRLRPLMGRATRGLLEDLDVAGGAGGSGLATG